MDGDADQRAEDLDEDLLDGEFPPDRPLGAKDQGVTAVEQLGGESVADRAERMEPEVWERPTAGEEAARSMVVEPSVRPADGDPDELDVAVPVEESTPTGPLAPDDEFSGDETTRDIAPERTPPPAEEAAMHVQEDEETPLE